MKKILSLFMILSLLLTALPPNATYASTNVPSSWAKSAIESLISKGAIPSHLQNDYQKPITRVEFSQLLVPILRLTQTEMGLAMEMGYDSAFSKEYKENLAPIDYYATHHNQEKSDKFVDSDDINVYKLSRLYIIKGTGVVKTYEVNGSTVRDHQFEPNSLITREQAAIMMVNTIDYNNQYTLSGAKPQGYKFVASYKPMAFRDKKDISSWAIGSVTLAVNNELISGVGDNKFSPKGSLTREQAMVMCNKIYNLFVNDDAFYDRVTKANDGYVYTEPKQTLDGSTQVIYTPHQQAIIDVQNGKTTKINEVVVNPVPTPANEDVLISYYKGDVSNFFGKSLADVEKIFGKYTDTSVDMYGFKSYTFQAPGIVFHLDKSGKIVGFNFYEGNNNFNDETDYNVFNKIILKMSQEQVRTDFKIIKEGVSRRDLLALHRMYPEFPGYMVELSYSGENDGVPLLFRVTVYKGTYKLPLDILNTY